MLGTIVGLVAAFAVFRGFTGWWAKQEARNARNRMLMAAHESGYVGRDLVTATERLKQINQRGR